MPRSTPPRLNRFPQRLDYTLIPAPLDLSLPLVDEKSPLPAIIVTPSSPSHEREFSIAFLAGPHKPSFRERLWSSLSSIQSLPSFRPRLPSQIQLPSSPLRQTLEEKSNWTLRARVRSTLIFAVLLFIMACHLILHEIISGHPHLEFAANGDGDLAPLNTGLVHSTSFASGSIRPTEPDPIIPVLGNWLHLDVLWPSLSEDNRRNARFIISEPESDPPQLS